MEKLLHWIRCLSDFQHHLKSYMVSEYRLAIRTSTSRCSSRVWDANPSGWISGVPHRLSQQALMDSNLQTKYYRHMQTAIGQKLILTLLPYGRGCVLLPIRIIHPAKPRSEERR